MEFVLKDGNFESVKKVVLHEFGLDDPEKAIYKKIQVTEGKRSLELQTCEGSELTPGARINIYLTQYYDGSIKAIVTPNHHIWDSSRPGIENVSRGISSALQKLLSE